MKVFVKIEFKNSGFDISQEFYIVQVAHVLSTELAKQK